MQLDQIINLAAHPIFKPQFGQTCKQKFDEAGVLILKNFLTPAAQDAIIEEGYKKQTSAFYTNSATTYISHKKIQSLMISILTINGFNRPKVVLPMIRLLWIRPYVPSMMPKSYAYF